MDFREVPIPDKVLEHTGRPDGDDTGYRDVAVCEEDVAGQGDPLVELDSTIRKYPVYAKGAAHGLCPSYGDGLGASETMLVRRPVNAVLLAVNEILRQYSCQVIVLDAFRSIETQRRLWTYLVDGLLQGRRVHDLTHREWIKIGIEADNIGSYVALATDGAYHRELDELLGCPCWSEIESIAVDLGMDPLDLGKLWLTFHHNYVPIGDMSFDTTSNTAHGGGGAVDAVLVDFNGQPLSLGVPFDYVGPESAMRYFEDPESDERFAEALAKSTDLRDLKEETMLAHTSIERYCKLVRQNRRLLYHAMMAAGATHYNAECWHWNFGNERFGRQFNRYPGAGSSCHSLLKDVRSSETGEWIAVWGNAWAQRRATEMIG